ncbi:hypothetical protein AVEN_98029-1 [Araneus ventricosus]|uniref:Uncharacterized protein n=1 Tax=Araneus ventricosus TaxID=182803 RepID=A0A4Y2G6N4_ARAVE|nr:hypothetical protein AVEN_98029-1 [Araneus ventricosus]
MPRHCVNTLRGIVKCRANSTTTAKIAVRHVKRFELDRERPMLREEDNILSNPVHDTMSLQQIHKSFALPTPELPRRGANAVNDMGGEAGQEQRQEEKSFPYR